MPVGTAMPLNANSHMPSLTPVRAAYDYAEYLPERRKMMQAWADFLEGLTYGAQAIPLMDLAAS
ncbi:MAG: integrase [Herminiimonas sp.]|nr:integrase [Herminiimonas sp.]